MSTHPVRIVQVFRVEREIVIDVEAASKDDAVEYQMEEDAPPSSDPRWKSEWTLQSEDVLPAD